MINKDCKGITNELECKENPECLFNKSNKCQKKISKTNNKTKKKKEKQQYELVISDEIKDNTVKDNTEHKIVLGIEDTLQEKDKEKEKEKDKVDPCITQKLLENEIRELKQKKTQFTEECNATKYMSESEQQKLVKLMDLIKYIHTKKIEKCQDLFDKFPESNERIKGLSRPYIFEALWKIIFLLRLDNLTDGYDREYKNSLNKDETITEYHYLNNSDDRISNINSGSVSGIADFYFTVSKKTSSDKKRKNISDKEETVDACKEIIDKPEIHDAYIFTSKFYKKEKGLTHYDIEGIAIEALNKYGYDKNKFKIVSLVRNGSEYKNRIQTSSKDIIKSYLDSNLILDESDLNLVYYPKLYNWINYHFKEKEKDINSEPDWRHILKNSIPIINILDNLRFHQKYVVEYTNQILDVNKENHGRFIWGAVARSGKSFMVGGLVAKRKPKFVLLILGAVNETKSQFIDELFKKYEDLKEYNVIDFQNSKERNKKIDPDEKYVVVISQESLRLKIFQEFCKHNLDDDKCKKIKQKLITEEEEADKDTVEKKVYNNEIIEKIKEFLVEPNKIIFFDEIHQGSGSDSMQEDTIRFFYNPEFPKPLIIMVTATYAKPLAKYGESIDGNESVLIEWNYEMIMKMKSFQFSNVSFQDTIEGQTNEIKEQYLIDYNSENFEAKMLLLKNITEELNEAGKTCEDIAHEYDKNPELVYLLPTLKDNYEGEIMDKDYNIITDESDEKINIKRNLKQIFRLKKGEKTFKYQNAVNKLLDYINDDVYDKLLDKEYDFVANGEGDFHSQLWFLPTSMKNDDGKQNMDAEPEDRTIVAPMLKNLGKAIINHPKFINFNVCVVHSGSEKERDFIESDDKQIQSKLYFKCIKGNVNVKVCIKEIENESKAHRKSLIILTAQRLRLGVSLPCVDVAIHMDNIKSYDIIYQSMFRVLTERTGKTKGFFVDMVIDRAIQFFYKYTKIQKNLKSENITREHVKKSLLLFDAGSIKKSLGFTSITTPVNSYKNIATEFKIYNDEQNSEFEKFKDELFSNKDDKDNSVDEYFEEGLDDDLDSDKSEKQDDKVKNNKKTVVGLLNNLYKNEAFKEELIEKIDNVFENVKKISNKGTKNKGKKINPFKEGLELGNEEIAKDDENKGQQMEDINAKFKNVVEQIINVFSLIILFNETDISLSDAVDIEKIKIDQIKECNDPEIMYYCYLISTRGDDNKIDDIVQLDDGRKGVIIDIILDNTEKKNPKMFFNILLEDKTNVTFTQDDFKSDKKTQPKIKNISIPYDFNLSDIDDEYIKNKILKTTELIKFLLENQTNEELINLFNIIKEEMVKLKDNIHNEKLLFNDIGPQICPDIFIKNEKVLNIIRKYLTPKESERKLFGEVFTPLELICEMLASLPEEIWLNPDLKWLDPSNGIGNFPIVIYYKLMDSLKPAIKNDEKRSKWIIEKMLYMNELNPVNVALSKKIFKMIDPHAKPNIYKGDFMKNYNKILPNEIDKFDVIVGNPPYNTSSSTGDNKPYLAFTFIAISILNQNGYLLFITPPAIYNFLLLTQQHKPSTKFFPYNKMLNILTINIDNEYIQKKYFKGVGSEFTYFLLQNTDYKNKTNIFYLDSTNVLTHKSIKLEEYMDLKIVQQSLTDPIYTSIRNKIFNSEENEIYIFHKAKFEGKYTRRIRSEQIKDGIVKLESDEINKYKIIESYNTKDNTFNPTIYYYKDKDDDYDKERIIVMNGPSYLYPHLISKNKFTLSDNLSYIICNEDNNCDNLLYFLKSKIFTYIDSKYRPTTSNLPLLKLISRLQILPKKIFNDDEEMYHFFKLSQDEINEINKKGSNEVKIDNQESINNSSIKTKTKRVKIHKTEKGKTRTNDKNNSNKKTKTKKERSNKKITKTHKKSFFYF